MVAVRVSESDARSGAALLGYGALLTGAFGVRTVLHHARTGVSGWLTPPTAAAWAGDGLFAAGAVAVVAAPVLQIVGVLPVSRRLDHVAIPLAGVALLAGGATIALVAQAQMRGAWRAGIEIAKSYELVRRGLFSVVRNPFYLGMMIASSGVALMVPNLASLTGWVALTVGCEIDVRLVEEPHLRTVHGAVFAVYERSTPRFIPALRVVPRR